MWVAHRISRTPQIEYFFVPLYPECKRSHWVCKRSRRCGCAAGLLRRSTWRCELLLHRTPRCGIRPMCQPPFSPKPTRCAWGPATLRDTFRSASGPKRSSPPVSVHSYLTLAEKGVQSPLINHTQTERQTHPFWRLGDMAVFADQEPVAAVVDAKRADCCRPGYLHPHGPLR